MSQVANKATYFGGREELHSHKAQSRLVVRNSSRLLVLDG